MVTSLNDHFKNFHYIVLSVNIFILIKILFLNSQTSTINDVFIVITIKLMQLNWLRFFNMTNIILFCNYLSECDDVIRGVFEK